MTAVSGPTAPGAQAIFWSTGMPSSFSISPSTIFAQEEIRRCIFKINFFTLAGFDINVGVTGEPASNSRGRIWGAPCMPGGECGEQHPCGSPETVQIHVSFTCLTPEISPGTTSIQFTASGSSEV